VASDGKILFTDYESFKEAMKLRFEDIKEIIEMESTKTNVYVLANDAAVSTSEFHEIFLMVSGDTIVRNGCWTMVFKKFNNEWKVIQENGTHTE